MFRRVLVANRGEIAVRVIRTCRRLGIETVLTVSDADVGSLPARLADKVIRIGPAAAADSYLNVDAVVGAALAAGVDAVHPGYGFLSENARLARACAAAGIVFIGPTPETLEAAGDKLAAREHASPPGLPVLPGGVAPAACGAGGDAGVAVAGRVRTSVAKAWCERSRGRVGRRCPKGVGARGRGRGSGRIGFPVLVKAAGGGGGRGLRVVRDAGRAGGRGVRGQRGGGGRRSVIPGCTWSATSSAGAMSRCRSWATGSGSSTWATGTARSSGGTRS